MLKHKKFPSYSFYARKVFFLLLILLVLNYLFSRLGSVGRPYPAWEVHVLNPDETGLGEIATRGRNACMGYLWEEGKTAELHDAEGYVLSGDLGRFDTDGFLYLTGRQKEIIVTAGGENIAPVPIEDQIKEALKDYIANCLVIGDKRKHLACILTLRTVLDDKNQPTDVLHPDVKEVNFKKFFFSLTPIDIVVVVRSLHCKSSSRYCTISE